MTHYVFTMTAGRTGTDWLAKLFATNLNCVAKHEYRAFGDFGVRTQDVGLMHMFNQLGNTDEVRDFWRRKFSLIPETPLYVEANHALAKCGLIENLDMLPEGSHVSIITLRRDWLRQAMSYLNRHDFANYSTVWLWYLDSNYQNNIVSPTPFANLAVIGHILWYMAEVEARQAYYRQLYADRYRFIDLTLEDMATPVGAHKLLALFGHEGTVMLPEVANANLNSQSPNNEDQIEALIERVKFDPETLAQNYIEAGRRLHVRNEGTDRTV